MIMSRLFNFFFWAVLPLYGGGGGKGGKSKSSQTQTSEPWHVQQPHLDRVFKEAHNLYKEGGPEYYPGQTYTDYSPQTQQALGLLEDRALAGSELNRAGQGLIQQTINGDFLNANPYMDAMYDNAAGAVTRNYRDAIAPTLDSTFSKAGRYGSNAHQTAHSQAQEGLGRTLSTMADDMYGSNYRAERQNQLNAVPIGSQLAETDYNDMARLLSVGQMYEGKEGEKLQGDMNKWNYEQNLPYQNLAQYKAMIDGNYGGTTTGTTTQSGGGGGLLGDIAGLATAGYGLFQNFSNPLSRISTVGGLGGFGGFPTTPGFNVGGLGTTGLSSWGSGQYWG